MCKITLGLVLGTTINGAFDNGKSHIYYVVRFNKKTYNIMSSYKVLRYDFLGGKSGKITRIPLYNELINEEIAKFHELKEKYDDPRMVFRNFRSYISNRNEI